MDYTYISTKDTLFISGEGRNWHIGSSEPEKRAEILNLIRNNASWEEIKKKLEPKKENENLREWCESSSIEGSGISFNDDTILIDNVPVYGALCSQIRLLHDEGLTLDPIVNFVRKMRKNPSYRIREQLWGFIEACQAEGGFTLANDGDIMAYKVVTSDYKDKHTRTFDNSIGSVVSMPREDVDDNPANTCSAGLHFCAYSYINSFSNGTDDRIVLVKVNPADVVSIPADYDSAKARCCRYQVVDEVKSSLNQPVWKNDQKENDKEKNETSSSSSCDFKCSRKYHIGDIIRVVVSDYIFPGFDDSEPTEVVGRIFKIDPDDDKVPYCICFYDGNDVVDEWWIVEKDIKELLERQGTYQIDCKAGDIVYICGTQRGRVMNVDIDKGYALVKVNEGIKDEESVEIIHLFDLQKKCFVSEKKRDECKMSHEDSSSLDELMTTLRELQKRIAEAESLKDDNDEDELVDSQEFVKNWFETKPKKMIIAFLESQFKDAIDSKMRLDFLYDIDVEAVIDKILDWIDCEYDGQLPIERIWDKIKTAIQFWSKRS